MDKTIKLAELLSTDIRSRRNADIIRQEISKDGAQSLVIDFGNVTFISRSFADELLNVLSENSDKNISLRNIASNVKTMLDMVKEGREKPRKMTESNNKITVLNDMKSLQDFFSLL